MEARRSVIIRNPQHINPESQRKRPESVQRSSVICPRQESVSRVSPYKLPQSSKQDDEQNSMDNDELRGIYFTLPQQKLFRGMMSFASNISDAHEVQYVSSQSPPASTNSHIRKPPVPRSFSSMQAHHVGHEQPQHPRLPSLPSHPITPKTTRKKGPVPKLYDGECCKICGDKASGFHYNVVSCEGCKGFYRRAILETRAFRCKGVRVGECMKARLPEVNQL